MGMGIALMLDKRQLADPRIGLAQLDTDMHGKPGEEQPWKSMLDWMSQWKTARRNAPF
jgi:hypothetical protein